MQQLPRPDPGLLGTDKLTVHANAQISGLLETSPGVRSCMIEYDATVLPLSKVTLSAALLCADAGRVLRCRERYSCMWAVDN